ncbi:MAG: flagellar biosynthesis protein FlgD [Methylibium sp.]|nr:flagellar biosynthesis protein FlgD [Methylibium sp.]
MDFTTLNKTTGTGTGAASQLTSKNAVDTQDRFLKLLVAQMQNQDPMNPMDNAQVTSQMAQIQTVSGISGLDKSIQSLSTQFGQMQTLQGVALVGRDVTVPGSKMFIEDNAGRGAYELSGPADKVKLEVLSTAGAVLDTVELGAQGGGIHQFDWAADKSKGYTQVNFRITATSGAANVSTTLYSSDKVASVSNDGGKLQLQLDKLGKVDYASIKSID